MTWHYQLIEKSEVQRGATEPTTWVELHELHLDDAGKPKRMTTEPLWVADDQQDMVADLRMALKECLERPPIADPFPEED